MDPKLFLFMNYSTMSGTLLIYHMYSEKCYINKGYKTPCSNIPKEESISVAIAYIDIKWK